MKDTTTQFVDTMKLFEKMRDDQNKDVSVTDFHELSNIILAILTCEGLDGEKLLVKTFSDVVQVSWCVTHECVHVSYDTIKVLARAVDRWHRVLNRGALKDDDA